MIRSPPIVCKAAVHILRFLYPDFPDLKYQCPNSRPILKLVPIWQFSVFPGEEGGEDSLWFLLPTPHAARGFLIKWNETRPRWGHFTLQLYFMSLECEHCPDVQPQSTNSPFGTWYAPDSQDALSKGTETLLNWKSKGCTISNSIPRMTIFGDPQLICLECKAFEAIRYYTQCM